jgi:hypothetical protein
MTEDPRCCGSGTCIIDAEGRCWCGQRWDGRKMCHARVVSAPAAVLGPKAQPSCQPPGWDGDQPGSPSAAR